MLKACSIKEAVLLALSCACLPLSVPAQEVAAEDAPADLPPPATQQVDFVKDLKSLFEERCFDCHGEKKSESGLRADSREFLLTGGDHGPSIVVSNSAGSILVQVLADVHPDIMGMPRKKEDFTPEQIGLVRAWIDQGAVWEGGARKYVANTNHWAFKRPVRPSVPTTDDKHWGSTAIDQFERPMIGDRKSTRLNSSHVESSYAVFCLKKTKFSASPFLKKIARRPNPPAAAVPGV